MLQSLCKLTPGLLEKDYGLFPVRVPLTLTHGGHSQLQRPTWKYFTEDWKRTKIVQSSNPQRLIPIFAYVGSVWAKVHLHLCNTYIHSRLRRKCRKTQKTTKQKKLQKQIPKAIRTKPQTAGTTEFSFLIVFLKELTWIRRTHVTIVEICTDFA